MDFRLQQAPPHTAGRCPPVPGARYFPEPPPPALGPRTSADTTMDGASELLFYVNGRKVSARGLPLPPDPRPGRWQRGAPRPFVPSFRARRLRRSGTDWLSPLTAALPSRSHPASGADKGCVFRDCPGSLGPQLPHIPLSSPSKVQKLITKHTPSLNSKIKGILAQQGQHSQIFLPSIPADNGNVPSTLRAAYREG